MENLDKKYGYDKYNKFTTQSETQTKSKNDIDKGNRRRSENSINNCVKKSIESEKRKNSLRIPNMRIDTNINSILHGKPLKQDAQSNSLLNINKNKEFKEMNVFSGFSKNYLSSDRNTDGNYSPTPILYQNEITNNNNTNSNFFTNESHFTSNIKLISNSKNFNTISNLESEGFYTTKNKYSNSIKVFGNINTTDTINTFNSTNMNINNFQNMNNVKKMDIRNCGLDNDKKIKSIDLGKTKSITNNKTEYKTLTSNIGTSKLNTLNSARNSKFNKFEAKLLSHFNNLKGQKCPRIGSPINKPNFINKKIETKSIFSKKQNSKCKKQKISNCENINNNIKYNNENLGIIKSDQNTYNRSTGQQKSIKNFNVKLKLNLEPEFNSKSGNINCNPKTEFNKNSHSSDIRLNNAVKEKDEKIRMLLSDQFKFSVDENNKNEFNLHNTILNNNLVEKKNLINFDINKKKENGRSLSIGERIYHKSIAMKSIKEKKASIELYKKDIETINNCSFRPRLCEDSIMMNIKVYKKNNINLWNYL